MSALGRNPRRKNRRKNNRKSKRLNNSYNNYMGAMGTDPSALVGNLTNRADKIGGRIDHLKSKGRNKKANRLQRRLDKVNTQIGNVQNSTPYQMQGVNNTANETTNQMFEQIQNQGAFKPQNLPNINQDYSQMRQQAEQRVMDSFNREMQPEFQRQDDNFRKQMALQGIPEGSEKWNLQYENMTDAQNSARQQAMDSAFQTGQGEQAQAWNQNFNANNTMFNQQYQTHQMPYQNLGAMTPYYSGQMGMMGQQANRYWQGQQQNQQNQFTAGQNQLNRDHQMSMQHSAQGHASHLAGMHRGGGGGEPQGMNDADFAWMQQFFANGGQG